MHSILSSLQGLSDMFVKKKDEQVMALAPEKKVKMIWDDFESEADMLRASLVAERDRQKAKLKVILFLNYSCMTHSRVLGYYLMRFAGTAGKAEGGPD